MLLPDWVRKARLGLKLTTRSQPAAAGSVVTQARFGLGDLVDFRYDVAVGDQVIDPAELAELARLKAPLVRLRGQWVELDEAHLKAALKFLAGNGHGQQAGTMTAADALLAGLGLAQGGPGDQVPLVGVDADGWLGDLLSGQADRRLPPMTAPASFAGTLRPYQERGLSWLSFLGDLGLGGILADDMGLGKTIQLLSLIAAQSPQAGPTLLVCPMSLVGNWQREATRFTPDLRVHVHHGADRLDAEGFAALLARGDDPPRPPRGAEAPVDLVITSYGVATRDRAALSTLTWARVVCDEAQNIKNHATKQARAIRALPAATRIALTGTPVENRLSELWSIMEFTNPGLLGPAERFREDYAIPIERHGSDDAARALQRLTQPFVLRRLKTDKTIISDLPDKQEMKVWCNLTAEQASLYAATVADMLARIEEAADDISRRGLVLATMAKLKQVCNHPAHLLGDGSRLPGRSGKLARLEEICDEIVAEGDKALCFTQYAEFGKMLQPHLAGLRLPGAVPARRNAQAAARRPGRDVRVAGGARAVPALAQGRRHRAQPDRGQPRDPRRPVVEPGRGGPGHRPGVPDRPAPERPGAQVRLRRHAGGADRRDDRGEEGPGRPGRGHRRELAHRAVRRRPARCAGAVPGCGERVSEPKGRGAAWTEERGTSDEGRRQCRGMGRRAGPRRRAKETA